MEWCDLLKIKPFGQTRTIDWGGLGYLGLADKVRRLVRFDRWLHIFKIDDPVYYELTMKVLSTFETANAQARLRQPGGSASSTQ